MRIVTIDQMKQLEKEAIQMGLSYDQMMLNAGNGLAEFIKRYFSSNPDFHVLGLVGPGNNGGDTLVALTNLQETGWKTIAYLSKSMSEEDVYLRQFLKSGGELIHHSIENGSQILAEKVLNSQLMVDGLLGTGINLPLRGTVLQILQILQKIKNLPDVVAVDCPSGVNADSGYADPHALAARYTLCMSCVKRGLLRFPAFALAGDIHTVDIGLPGNLPAWKEITGTVITAKEAARLLPERPPNSHKGTYGTCMIIAGSSNYYGAPLLAAKAAYRAGTGLVRIATTEGVCGAIAGKLPEAIWLELPDNNGAINAKAADVILGSIDKVTSILIGPGLGLTDDTFAFMKRLFSGKEEKEGRAQYRKISLPQMVLDADALKLISIITDWPKKIPARSILTPHPGEMAAITGIPVLEIQANRIKYACEFAQKWGHIVVLKGAGTIIAAPEGGYSVIPIATSALAKAGTGDVLAGMISGFLAQRIEAYDAARLAVWIHAEGGKHAAVEIGTEISVLAGDVIRAIPAVINKMSGTSERRT